MTVFPLPYTRREARGSLMRRALLVTALVLATLGLLARLGRPEPSGKPESPVPLSTERGATVPAVPEAPALPLGRHPGEPTLLAATRLPDDLVLAEASIEVPGIVADLDGQPLAGADVWFVPSGEVLRAAGLTIPSTIPFIGLGRKGPDLLMDVRLDVLAHATSDARGAFIVRGSGHRGDASRDLYPPPSGPVVVVRAQGRAIGAWSVSGTADALAIRLPPEAAVVGRVLDEDGSPLPGVSVRLLDNVCYDAADRSRVHDPEVLLGALHSTVSDANGAFRLGGLWRGRAQLGFSAPGRVATFADDVRIENDEHDLGPIELRTGGVIEGRVVDEAGRGLAEAVVFSTETEVSITGRGCVISGLGPEDDGLPFELESEWSRTTCRAVTDSEGRFRLEGLGVPTVTLYGRAEGREPDKRRDVSTGARDAVLTLRPEAVLVARVVERGTLAPLPGAKVTGRRIVGEQHDSAPLVAESSGDAYTIHGVGRLGTELTASAPGYATATVRVAGQEPGERQEATVELARAASITGRVLGLDGEAISGARVSLSLASDKYPLPRATAVSEADGTFRLQDLPADDWLIAAKVEGRAPRPARPVSTRSGESLEGMELVLEPGATLEVIVHELEEGAQAPRHQVSVRRPGEDERDLASRSSGDDGRCTLTDLPSGPLVVIVKNVATRELTLAPGDRQTLRLAAVPPRVTVRVLEDGRPAAGIRVAAQRPDQRWLDDARSPPSDAEGRVALILPTVGAYEVVAFSTGEPERETGAIGRSAPFEIDWGQSREVELTIGSGEISGGVASSRGSVPGEVLYVKGPERDGYRLVSTDASGRFVVDRLLPGTYRISTNWSCEHGAHIGLDSGPLVLEAGQRIHHLPLVLRWGARLTGTVRVPGGALAPESSSVRLMDSEGQQKVASTGVSQGRYELSGVAPGRYRLCAEREASWRADGPCGDGSPVEVTGEESIELDLEIPAAK